MVKFNLLNKKHDITPIYLIYSYGGSKPFRWSTSMKVSPKVSFWDYDRQRAKKAWPTADTLNSFLDRCAGIVTNVHTNYRLQGLQVTDAILRDALNKQTVRPAESKTTTLLSYIDEWIERREKSKQFAPATILTYKKRKNLIHKFFKDKRRVYNFEEVDLDFMYKLKAWMIEDESKKSSTIKKLVQFLSAIMEESYEEGIHKNTSWQSKAFSLKAKLSDHIALSLEDLDRLAAFDVQVPHLAVTRDRFLVGCNVGQRYSDLFKVSLDQCYESDGQMMFRFRSKKVLHATVIPIPDIVARILEKYKGSLPPISNQKFNAQLKDLFKLVEFTEMTTVYQEEKGELIPKAYPKYKLITTHTMRRTFITNALEAKIPINIIMDVTGIRSVATVMRYNKSDKDRSALTVSRSGLFNIKKAN